MADNEMEIILNLVDNATKELKSSMDGIKESVDGVKKQNDEAFNKMNDSLKQVKKSSDETTKNLSKGFQEGYRSIIRMRSALVLVVAAIYSVVKATQSYAKYNKEARDSADDFELSVNKLSSSFGKLVNAKIMGIGSLQDGLNNIVKGLATAADFYGNALSGKGFTFSSQDDVERVTKVQQQLKHIQEDLKQITDEYINGRATASQYWNTINDGANLDMQLRQQQAAQMQELALLERNVRNTSLMEDQRINQERIALLNEYKENYNIAHQGMAAFTVMLSQTIRTNLTTALTEMIMGTRKAREIWKELGQILVAAIVQFMVQKAVSFALEKTLLAATVAANQSAAAAVGAAWAVPAALVSLATLGLNAAPAAAGMIAVSGLSVGLVTTGAALSKTVSGAEGGGGSAAINSSEFMSQFSTQGTPAWGGAQASGGDYLVSRPTLFLAGESGPERATFSPSGTQSSARGNVYIDIKVDRPTVARESDIDYLVEEISTRLSREVERIR